MTAAYANSVPRSGRRGRLPGQTLLLAIDIAVKAALIGLLLLAVAAPDLPQFEGKSMVGRAIGYPIAVLVVPAVWWLAGRSRGWSYPYVIDILFGLPFLIDMAGNAANLYDTIDWWDDANHFVNWAILTAGFGQLLIRLPLGKAVVAGLAIGFGAVTAVLWEFLEYATFIRNSPELQTAYTDTLGDLALGLCGAILAAALTVTVLWPRAPRVPRPPIGAGADGRSQGQA